MFLASKILSFTTQPLSWVLLLLLLSIVSRPFRHTWAQVFNWAALAILLLQGWELLPDILLRQLETQYAEPAPQTDLQDYVGVVVLGGALEPSYVWQGHQQPALNDAAERMTAAITLLQNNPHLNILFTGGEGELFTKGLSEAERAKTFFDSMDIAPERVMYESESHTTYENAVLSASMAGVNIRQPWLLLTSASHMPRAMATFGKAGWNVTAYPVDYRTGKTTPWTQYSLTGGARKWHNALHELLGLMAYRMAGRAF